MHRKIYKYGKLIKHEPSNEGGGQCIWNEDGIVTHCSSGLEK